MMALVSILLISSLGLVASLVPPLRAVPSSHLRCFHSQRCPGVTVQGKAARDAAAEGIALPRNVGTLPRNALSTSLPAAAVQPWHWGLVLWRFSRPHTLIGSALSIPALSIYAAPAGLSLADVFASPLLPAAIAYALLPALLMNVYITGLNQICDVEIDRINKPALPLPAGKLSLRAARATVILCLLGGLALGDGRVSELASPALRTALWASAALGTAYSLPPLRLKRFPLMASLCIMSVRGVIINACFFIHAATVAFGAKGGLFPLAPLELLRCLTPVAFFTLFGVVIALVKDIPDVPGDRRFGIRSFSVRLGQHKMLRIGVGILSASLAAAAAVCGAAAVVAVGGGLWAAGGQRLAVAVAAAWSLGLVRSRARRVDAEDGKQVYGYYMMLWKIFFVSYLCLPFVR